MSDPLVGAATSKLKELREENQRLAAELAVARAALNAATQVAETILRINAQNELAAARAECERLTTAEAELYDKCGELQKLVWKLEAELAGGGE